MGASLVVYAALVDAGFSGDWSRVGVLTQGQEGVLQEVCKFILTAHSAVAVIAMSVASKAGYPLPIAGIKGLLFGTLGLYDVHLRCEAAKEPAPPAPVSRPGRKRA